MQKTPLGYWERARMCTDYNLQCYYQQEKGPGRKAKGEDIVWVQLVFAIFHIGSFYERSKHKTTAVADSICAVQENNKEKNKGF